jgi:hypothetical protein
MLRISFFLILSSTLFFSCERAIEFSPRQTANELVVEATIENGQPPRVILSRSLAFFSTLTPAQLQSSFVHGAALTITDGNRTHVLKEYAVPVAGYQFYYYSTDSADLATEVKGNFNTRYELTIIVDGKIYSSSTTIPALSKTIDSLWYTAAPDNPDSTKVVVMGRATDPPGYGNYIRYFTSTNLGPYLPGLASVFDDQIVDGNTYNVQIEQGVDRNTDIDFETYSFFTKGDTVDVKLTNIDKATYDFWRTMEYSYSGIGNPFSSPTRVLGNVTGGALGYFGGYAVQYSRLIIPK